jgi:hypothetical protein
MMLNVPMRRFRVHARHIENHYARTVIEATFEAAVIAYIEDFPAMAVEDPEISIIVHDLDSGHEHCFRVDLTTGETAACG